MSLIPGATGSTTKAVDGLEGASSGAPVVLPSGFQGSSRPSTLADADITLTSTSNPDMVMTPTATRTITLASTGVPANYVVRVINKATSFNILINSSAGNLVATVPGGSQATVMSNIASPTTAGNWNTNSYGDVFGPASATDNEIARYDGTSGKLIQNSGVTIDDNNKQVHLGVAGNSVYTAYNQATANSGKTWRVGHTGAVAGYTSFDVYNETDNVVALSASSAGAVTLGPSTGDLTHSFNSTSDFQVKRSSGSNFPAVSFRRVSDGNFWYFQPNSGASNQFEHYYNSTLVSSVSTAGAVTLGPSSGSVNHKIRIPTNGDYIQLEGNAYQAYHVLDATAYTIGQNSGSRVLRIGSGANYMAVGVALGVGGTSWGTYSDIRMKRDITPLSYGLSEIERIETIRFNYLTDAEETPSRIGFSAQNIKDVIVEAHSEDNEGKLSVASAELIPVLVNAIKELKAELDAAKARIEVLEAV